MPGKAENLVAELTNPWQIAQEQLAQSAQRIGLPSAIHQKLANPKRIITVFNPHQDGRRQLGSIHRLSGPAQRGTRPVQRRHPLSP